jgi:hypothetical protein
MSKLSGNFDFKGFWNITCRDKFTKQIKWKEYVFNLITYQCLDDILDVYFSGGTAYGTHYLFLYDDDKTPGNAWTYAGGGTGGSDFNEFIDYDESPRPTWQEAGPSNRQITNSATPAVFTASSAVSTTIYGSGMVNVSTKGDNASGVGKIICATRFGTPRPFAETEEIQIVYTFNATSA